MMKKVRIPTTGRTFVSLYRKATRNKTTCKYKIKRTYKQREAPKSKRHKQGGRGLNKFLETVVKSSKK